MTGTAFDGNAARLAELLAMRLCHDFSGLIGTLSGALELLDEVSPAIEAKASEALELAGDAASSLSRRLRLLRAAWGAASAALSVAEFERLAGGVAPPRHRLHLDLVTAPGGFSATAGQLALNAVLLAAESLPRGGVVAISGDPTGLLQVGIEGPQAGWPAGLADLLVDPRRALADLPESSDATAVRSLQPLLTALFARRSGHLVSLAPTAADAAPPPLMLRLTAF
jgi:hypothetical protein